jgi:hypothetical protein
VLGSSSFGGWVEDGDPWTPARAQALFVPARSGCAGLVRTLEELEQRFARVGRGPHLVVGEQGEGAGSTGDRLTPRNGQFRFTVSTVSPTAPADSCPNPMWTATVTDVHFTTARLTLFEDTTVSDTITVPVS